MMSVPKLFWIQQYLFRILMENEELATSGSSKKLERELNEAENITKLSS